MTTLKPPNNDQNGFHDIVTNKIPTTSFKPVKITISVGETTNSIKPTDESITQPVSIQSKSTQAINTDKMISSSVLTTTFPTVTTTLMHSNLSEPVTSTSIQPNTTKLTENSTAELKPTTLLPIVSSQTITTTEVKKLSETTEQLNSTDKTTNIRTTTNNLESITSIVTTTTATVHTNSLTNPINPSTLIDETKIIQTSTRIPKTTKTLFTTTQPQSPSLDSIALTSRISSSIIFDSSSVQIKTTPDQSTKSNSIQESRVQHSAMRFGVRPNLIEEISSSTKISQLYINTTFKTLFKPFIVYRHSLEFNFTDRDAFDSLKSSNENFNRNLSDIVKTEVSFI